MKLRFLSRILDISMWLDARAHAFYLAAWHAHANALPRRAGDGELFKRSVEMDYEAMQQ